MERFAAFHHPNFRRYFVGQVVSSVGTWLQSLAITWLVLDITGRGDRLGLAVALQFLPLLLLGVPAGLLADRVDNRRLLIATSALSGSIALGFGAVVAGGTTSLPVIYGFTLASGLVAAVERPAMQAFLFQLVGPATLPNAVAANSTIVSVSRLFGPALGGILIAVSGVEVCFFLNALSYVAVLVAFLRIDRRRLVARAGGTGRAGSIRAAAAYVRHHREVRRPLLVMSIVGLVALNFQTTFPAMVRFGFDKGAGAVGTAMSVSAIGSILGGVFIAGVTPHPRRTLAVVLTAFGTMLVAVAFAPGYTAFLVLSIPLGFASAAFQSVDTTILQQATEPSMQGRVMALQQMAMYGTTPLGSLGMGWVVQHTSARVPFALAAVAAMACAVPLLRRRGAPAGEPAPDTVDLVRR